MWWRDLKQSLLITFAARVEKHYIQKTNYTTFYNDTSKVTMTLWRWLWYFECDYDTLKVSITLWRWLWHFGGDYDTLKVTMALWRWPWYYEGDFDTSKVTVTLWGWFWQLEGDYDTLKVTEWWANEREFWSYVNHDAMSIMYSSFDNQ